MRGSHKCSKEGIVQLAKHSANLVILPGEARAAFAHGEGAHLDIQRGEAQCVSHPTLQSPGLLFGAAGSCGVEGGIDGDVA